MTQSNISSTISPSIGSLVKLSLQVLIRPSERLFRAGSQVNSLIISSQLTIWIASSVILGWLYRMLNPIHVPETNNSIHINVSLLQQFSLTSSLGMVIIIPLVFLIDTGIIYSLARRSGGVASFREQCASMLLFITPLGIFNGIVAFVPYLGSVIVILCFVYGIILQIKAVSAVHNLPPEKAIGPVLLPLVVLFMLGCVFSVVFLGILITAAR